MESPLYGFSLKKVMVDGEKMSIEDAVDALLTNGNKKRPELAKLPAAILDRDAKKAGAKFAALKTYILELSVWVRAKKRQLAAIQEGLTSGTDPAMTEDQFERAFGPSKKRLKHIEDVLWSLKVVVARLDVYIRREAGTGVGVVLPVAVAAVMVVAGMVQTGVLVHIGHSWDKATMRDDFEAERQALLAKIQSLEDKRFERYIALVAEIGRMQEGPAKNEQLDRLVGEFLRDVRTQVPPPESALPPSGVPTWAWIGLGAAVLGGAAWYLFYREDPGLLEEKSPGRAWQKYEKAKSAVKRGIKTVKEKATRATQKVRERLVAPVEYEEFDS